MIEYFQGRAILDSSSKLHGWLMYEAKSVMLKVRLVFKQKIENVFQHSLKCFLEEQCHISLYDSLKNGNFILPFTVLCTTYVTFRDDYLNSTLSRKILQRIPLLSGSKCDFHLQMVAFTFLSLTSPQPETPALSSQHHQQQVHGTQVSPAGHAQWNKIPFLSPPLFFLSQS